MFCLFWASANGGSAAAQAIAETVTYHKVTGGMPGAGDKYQIKGFGTASNLPNNVIQNVTFQYDFQERLADDGTGNPGAWTLLFSTSDYVIPANGTATSSTAWFDFTPVVTKQYRVKVDASYVIPGPVMKFINGKGSDPLPTLP